MHWDIIFPLENAIKKKSLKIRDVSQINIFKGNFENIWKYLEFCVVRFIEQGLQELAERSSISGLQLVTIKLLDNKRVRRVFLSVLFVKIISSNKFKENISFLLYMVQVLLLGIHIWNGSNLCGWLFQEVLSNQYSRFDKKGSPVYRLRYVLIRLENKVSIFLVSLERHKHSQSCLQFVGISLTNRGERLEKTKCKIFYCYYYGQK